MRGDGVIAVHALRATLHSGGATPLLAIGTVNAIAARIAAAAGFGAMWVSGLEVSASMGLPDTNVLSVPDLVPVIVAVRMVTDRPVIVDVDNAGGSVDSARRYAMEVTRAGAAAVCVEDSAYPKCNSFSQHRTQELADLELTCAQIRAMRRVVGDELVIIGRTEALIHGTELVPALDRAARLAASGADAVLVHSKDPSGHQALEVAAGWRHRCPLVVVPTAFPELTWKELGEVGFRLCIYANQLSRTALVAMRSTANEILACGRAAPEAMSDVQELIRIGDGVGPR